MHARAANIAASLRFAPGASAPVAGTGFDLAVGPRTVHAAAALPWHRGATALRTP